MEKIFVHCMVTDEYFMTSLFRSVIMAHMDVDQQEDIVFNS